MRPAVNRLLPRLLSILIVVFSMFGSAVIASEAPDAAHSPAKLGELMNVAAVAPFALLLMCIALFPLLNPHWWEHNRNKGIIVATLGLPVIAYLFTFGHHGVEAMEHSGKEYVSFLLLLGSLFVISGVTLVLIRKPSECRSSNRWAAFGNLISLCVKVR